AGGADAFLLKYDADGNIVWQRTYGTTTTQFGAPADEFGNGVAVSPDGLAVYMTGQYGDGSAFLAKFDSAGALIWQLTYGTNGTFSDGVAVGSDGSVYLAGGGFDLGPQGDVFVAKFTSAGTLVWNRIWGGPNFDAARDIAIGTDGGIYVAGETNSFVANDAFL